MRGRLLVIIIDQDIKIINQMNQATTSPRKKIKKEEVIGDEKPLG